VVSAQSTEDIKHGEALPGPRRLKHLAERRAGEVFSGGVVWFLRAAQNAPTINRTGRAG
jgi:hypothetical protein